MNNPNATQVACYDNEDRGFNNTFTGRLICPRSWLQEYDQDPYLYVLLSLCRDTQQSRFCKRVKSGKFKPTHDDMPAVFYPDDDEDWNADEPEIGLFCSPKFAHVSVLSRFSVLQCF